MAVCRYRQVSFAKFETVIYFLKCKNKLKINKLEWNPQLRG
jgi:hypothetical protein